jgi:hypothetical protein
VQVNRIILNLLAQSRFTEMGGERDPVPKGTQNRRNNRWTDEENDRLITLLANDTPWRLIATELKRSYVAVETRASKLQRLASKTSRLNDDAHRLTIFRPNIREPEPLNLTCYTTSDAALAVVRVLYEKAMIYRAATIAKSNRYQKLKPRLQSVIATIVRELLGERHRSEDSGWLKVSTSRVRASQIGISIDVFRNLLDALEHDGFIERLNGYADAMELTDRGARQGRVTQVRGTVELFDLCAYHQITPDNASTHFSPVRDGHSENNAVSGGGP